MPCICYGQRVEGLVTFMINEIGNPNLIKGSDAGAKVYLIPCATCKAIDFTYIMDYSLNACLLEMERQNGEDEIDSFNSDSVRKVIYSLENRKNSKETIVDAHGNYIFNDVSNGRYLIIIQSRRLDRFHYEIVTIKGKESKQVNKEFF